MRNFPLLIMFTALLISFLNLPAAYSEDKKAVEQCEGYKIYVVEKLDTVIPSADSGYIPLAATGTNNNYLLVDSCTGKTWILTNIGSSGKSESGKDLTIHSFAWEPVFFKTEVKPLWSKGLSIIPK
jgi:hypothetical protein